MKPHTKWLEGLPGLDASVAVVIGAHWSPRVAGTSSEVEAQKKAAIQAKDTIYLVSDKVFGSAHPPSQKLRLLAKAKMRSASGAMAFASLHQHGTALLMLDMGMVDPSLVGHVWVTACNGGTPLKGFDTIVSLTQATNLLQQLRERYDGVVQFGQDGEAFEWPELFRYCNSISRDNDASFKPLKASLTGAMGAVPGPIKLLVLVAGTFLIGKFLVVPMGKSVYQQFFAPKAVVEDPVAMWEAASEAWLAERKLPAKDSLKAAVEGILDMPSAINAWQLASAECKLQASNKAWDCRASYQRPVKNTLATSRTFSAMLPKTWSVSEWKSLNEAWVQFSVPVTGTPVTFKVNEQDTRAEVLVAVPSAIQSLLPVIADVASSLGKFEAVKVTPPVFAAGGSPPKPPQLNLPSRSEIALTGPMRSFIGIEDVDALKKIAWRSIAVTFSKDAVNANRSTSRFQTVLTGEVYAR
jgi:hypothetical protein